MVICVFHAPVTPHAGKWRSKTFDVIRPPIIKEAFKTEKVRKSFAKTDLSQNLHFLPPRKTILGSVGPPHLLGNIQTGKSKIQSLTSADRSQNLHFPPSRRT